jgi:hypothetical protein
MKRQRIMITRDAELRDAGGIAKVHVRSWQAAYAGIVPDEDLAQLSVDHMQENNRGVHGAKKAKTTRRPRRVSLRIAITLPAALHLEAKRKARSLSMNLSEYMRSLIRKDLEVVQK